MVEYTIKDSGDSIRVNVMGYTIAEFYYKTQHTQSPLNSLEAEELANKTLKKLEKLHPSDSIDESDYEPSELSKFLDSMFEDDEFGSCDCDCDDSIFGSPKGEDLLKMMLLAKLLE